MKFIYVDESGSPDQSNVFAMCGLMVDAYKLRKKTAALDEKLEALFALHPGARADLKTRRFINGMGGWNQIDAQERKDFLESVCRLAIENGSKIFGFGLSFDRFNEVQDAGYGHPFGNSYWTASAMFIGALVQKKMQSVSNGKGLTVLIMDDNKQEMAKLSEGFHRCDPWYDGLYQCRGTRRGRRVWLQRKPDDRFDQIVNTAFAIKSDHSSLVQVADALSYVYRRHLELCTDEEAYAGERNYYRRLLDILDPQRERLGQVPVAACVGFYHAASHPNWQI